MTDFTEDTSPTSDDLIWTTNAPAGTAADRKVTLGNLLLWMATQDWTFSGAVTLPVITLADASTLTLPAAAPTEGKEGIMVVTDAGESGFTTPTEDCFFGGSGDGATWECKSVSSVWDLMWAELVDGEATDEQLVCFETTDGAKTLKSCGAKTTYTEPAGTLKAICDTGTLTTGACDPTAHPGGFSSIEIGHASDTTLARSAAGVVTIEGNVIALAAASQTGVHATPSTTNPLAPTWTTSMHTVWYGATGEIDLPAASGYTGRGIIIYNTGAYTITIDPNGSEVIVRDGTVQSGGVSITLSSGAGNYVSLFCDGARWITLGYKGTLAEGS